MDAKLLDILVCPLCKGPLIYKKAEKELKHIPVPKVPKAPRRAPYPSAQRSNSRLHNSNRLTRPPSCPTSVFANQGSIA